MAEEKKRESFIGKHKPLTSEEVGKRFKEMEDSKRNLEQDALTIEKNLDNFNKIIDPIKNPANGEILCWVRRPTQDEWEEMIPEEMWKTGVNPESLTMEMQKKSNDMVYEFMAKIIEKPKHDAKWWKGHANLVFIQLFQLHLNDVFRELGLTAENF